MVSTSMRRLYADDSQLYAARLKHCITYIVHWMYAKQFKVIQGH